MSSGNEVGTVQYITTSSLVDQLHRVIFLQAAHIGTQMGAVVGLHFFVQGLRRERAALKLLSRRETAYTPRLLSKRLALHSLMPSIAFLESPAAWCAFGAAACVFIRDLRGAWLSHHHPHVHHHHPSTHHAQPRHHSPHQGQQDGGNGGGPSATGPEPGRERGAAAERR